MATNNGNAMVSNETDKFLGLKVPSQQVKVVEMHKWKKPFMKIDVNGCQLCVVGYDKIGMLADFIEIPRAEMHRLVNDSTGISINRINQAILQQGDRIMQINCSKYQEQWYVFAFSTETHVIVPFNEIKAVVVAKWQTIEESVSGYTKIYERKFRSIETTQEKFDVCLRCTSGRNIKDTAMKVIVLLRVKSCMNSVIAAEYESVKHTENWKARLEQYLETALLFAQQVEATLNMGMLRSISLENGIAYINSQNFGLKDQDKINRLQVLLIARFKLEFEKHKTAWSLSQALSYVGTHTENEPAATEHALEMMQTQAFTVLAENPSAI